MRVGRLREREGPADLGLDAAGLDERPDLLAQPAREIAVGGVEQIGGLARIDVGFRWRPLPRLVGRPDQREVAFIGNGEDDPPVGWPDAR